MDCLTEENIKKNIKTKYVGRKIIHFNMIDSTNAYAKNMENTLENGTVITCEEQTLGRGRLGRKWESKNGSLSMSIFLKPEINSHHVSKVTQVCAAAVCKALEGLGVNTQIKWPNDIFLNDKKICGILTEIKTEKNSVGHIIIGIGLNVNNDDFSEEIRSIASSIFLETGMKLRKSLVAAEILNNFELLYNEFLNRNFKKSLDICREDSYIIGKQIDLIENKIAIRAKAVDLGNDGELIIQYEDGRTDFIISGEVSVRLS